MFFILRLNNHNKHIVTHNQFNGDLVAMLFDEEEAVVFESTNRNTDFDERTKLISLNSLNVFIAEKNEETCSFFRNKKREKMCL